MPDSGNPPASSSAKLVSPAVGELRYFPTVGLVVRVVSYSGDSAVVEHIPSGHRVILKATRELMDAYVVHEHGFRARWCRGALSLAPGTERDILDAIFLDENANGRDRIRLRALDDYLAPIMDSEEPKARLRTALTGTDAWVKVGRGAELGYAPASTSVDWRERWTRDGIRLPSGAEGMDENGAILALWKELSRYNCADLGRITACPWLPSGLRSATSKLLAEKWLHGRDSSAFHSVLDEAMLRMIDNLADKLDDKGWRSLLVSNVLSPSVREEALKRWRATTGDVTVSSIVNGFPRVDDALVAVDLFRIAKTDEDLIATLANIFCLPAPDDDEGKGICRRLVERGRTLGQHLFPITVAAARRSLSIRGSVRTIEPWLVRLSADVRPSLYEVCRALATMEVLERPSTELAALAAPRMMVENGLTRWLQSELPDHIRDDIDIVSFVASVGPAGVVDYTAARVQSRDHVALGKWVVSLATEADRLYREVSTLRARVDDVANARRVLERNAAEQTRSERQGLRESAFAEVEGIRRREREKVARMISEAVTAVERILEAGGPAMLSNLARRLRELSTDFGLTVVGQLGEVVVVDPKTHDSTAQAGSMGEIRRVGVVDQDGSTVVKLAVVSREGTAQWKRKN